MRPTGLGLKAALFYVVLLGAFFAAPYTNLFFLLLAFLTLLGLVGLAGAHRNLAGVSGGLGELEPAPAGAGAPLCATLDGGPRPRFALVLEFALEGADTVRLPVAVLRGETRITGIVPPLPRGVYAIAGAWLASAWPLGLFTRRVALTAPGALVIYPAPAELATTRAGSGGVGDLYDALGAADGFLQPSNLREYRPGDELRLVHWKASARRTELVVKEWEGGTGSGHEVVLDRRCRPAALEDALSVVSALALAAEEQKELLTVHSQGLGTTSVHSQGLGATFGAGRRPWRELLEFLARAEALEEGAEPPPAVSPSILRVGGGV